jgi:hypothetical protein
MLLRARLNGGGGGRTDLVPKENVERWLKYLRNEYPTVAFKASTQTQRTHIGQASVSFEHASDSALGTSECIGTAAPAFGEGEQGRSAVRSLCTWRIHVGR